MTANNANKLKERQKELLWAFSKQTSDRTDIAVRSPIVFNIYGTIFL